MNKIVFTINNTHKLEEVKVIMGERIEILSLKEINCFDDIPETRLSSWNTMLQLERTPSR